MTEHVDIVPSVATEIEEYSKTALGLADLRRRFEGVEFEVETKAGMQLARAGRAELRTLRVDLEKMRIALKAPLLERGRALDAEAKRLTREIAALEDPIDLQIKRVEEREAAEKAAREKAEQERLTAIAQRIEDIRRRPLDAVGRNAAQLGAMLRSLHELNLSDLDPADRMLAEDARVASTASIQDAWKRAVEQEEEATRLARERVELDRQRAEQNVVRAAADAAAKAERDRLDAEAAREREEARARMVAAQADLDAKLAAQRWAEEEKARAEAEAAQDRQFAEDQRRIETTSLIDAARDAHAYLVATGAGTELVTLTLAAALERAEASS